MQLVLEEIMKIGEFTDIKYFGVACVIVLGCLIIWRLWK